jgi:hypothetical protein
MLFRENFEEDRRVWVDRGIDGRVDDFQICRPCGDTLGADDPNGRRWHDGSELCSTCRADFAAHALATDLFGLPRPFNGDIEGRYITNGELDAPPPFSVPGAFDYFLME